MSNNKAEKHEHDYKLIKINHPFYSHKLECKECGHIKNRLAIS